MEEVSACIAVKFASDPENTVEIFPVMRSQALRRTSSVWRLSRPIMRSWSLSWQRSCRSGKNNRDGDVVGRRSSLDKVALIEGEKLHVHPVGAQQTLELFVEQTED